MKRCIRRALLSVENKVWRNSGKHLFSLWIEELHCVNCRQLRTLQAPFFPSKCIRTVDHKPLSTLLKPRRQGTDFGLASRCISVETGKSTSTTPPKKNIALFPEKENEYFHSFFESRQEYHPYLLSTLSSTQFPEPKTESVDQLLKKVSEEENIRSLLSLLHHWSQAASNGGSHVLLDTSFAHTVKLLKKNIFRLSTAEMLESMACLSKLGFRQSNQVLAEQRELRISLSNALDRACSSNIQDFNTRELLLAGDFFYWVRGSSFTDFPFLMCQRLKPNVPSLSREELVLVLFQAVLSRKAQPEMIDPVLHRLKHYMASMTLQELGLVNLAHFKTRSRNAMPQYYNALAQQLDSVEAGSLHPVCLSSLLKYQNKSLNRCKDRVVPKFFAQARDLEASLLPVVLDMNAQTMMHVLHFYYSVDLLSEDLFLAVLNRVLHRGVADWRLKDISKVLQIVSNVPLGSESKMEALAAILVDLQREQRLVERQRYPVCMLQIAVALTYTGVYPHWLAEEVFGDASQRKLNGAGVDFREDMYHLSESISIEDSSYLGPLLWPENFPRLSKTYRKLKTNKNIRKKKGGFKRAMESNLACTGKLFHRDWMLLELMDTIVNVHPDVTVLPAFLLSHFKTADVEIQLTDRYQAKNSNIVGMHIPSEAVLLHHGNAYQNIQRTNGKTVPMLRQYHAMRARQLRKLGTTVVEVPHFEFQGQMDKEEYLLSKFKLEEDRLLGPDCD